MNKAPNRIKLGQEYYNTADFSKEIYEIYLKYLFAAKRESEVQQYLAILTGHKIFIAKALKKEILSSKVALRLIQMIESHIFILSF